MGVPFPSLPGTAAIRQRGHHHFHARIVFVHRSGSGIDTETNDAAEQHVARRHHFGMRGERSDTRAVALSGAGYGDVVLALGKDDVAGRLHGASDSGRLQLAHRALDAGRIHRNRLLGAFDNGRTTAETDGNQAALRDTHTPHSPSPRFGPRPVIVYYMLRNQKASRPIGLLSRLSR